MKNFEIYKKNILSYDNKGYNEIYFLKESCTEYISLYKNCELKLAINTTTHKIDSILVTTLSDNKYLKSVMKAFYSVIKSMPILEAQDHSVLRLEELLRDDSVSHSIKGVIMPTNSCELFDIPQYLIRDIFKQYSQNEDYTPLSNTYTPLSIFTWKKLTCKERETIIKEKVSNFCKLNDIENYDFVVIGDMRIEFIVDKDKYYSLGKLLFDMERSIGKELGFSLEIMFSEKKDANRKRKIKEVNEK